MKTSAKPVTKRTARKTRGNKVTKPERTPEQQALVKKWRATLDRLPEWNGDVKNENVDLVLASFAEALGVQGLDPILVLLGQGVGTFYGTTTALSLKTNALYSAVHNIAPKDHLEAMLALQMVGVHNAVMEMLRRAALPEQTNMDAIISRVTKLLRTYTAQVETLQRYRGKSTQQKVTVEHVHVNAGGQAIVGAVTGPTGGVGAPNKANVTS